MPEINPVELILKKREGKELRPEEINWFIQSFMQESIPEYQMSALLMAAFFQGLSKTEISALTQSYIDSGDTLDFSPELKVADKHSTGGVGDKLSLMLAPIGTCLGLTIPMISGRGLGHTGGTLDKLEAIPGFRTQYTMDDFKALVEKHGCALVGQSAKLVPADKRIYALRDVTATVESPGLITASIMSKKIAEGARHLVIDLKVGSGAFMPDLDKARHLAGLLISTGARFDQKVKVVFTNMNSPLGNAIGNGLETAEAIDYLKGKYLPDTYQITTALLSQMLISTGIATDHDHACQLCDTVVANGSALDKFREIIIAQNGDPRVIEDYSLLGTARFRQPIIAASDGFVNGIDSRAVGYALVQVKAGRMQVSDAIDPGAGAILPTKIGCKVRKGETIGEVLANIASEAKAASDAISRAFLIGPEPVEEQKLILDIQ
jgi:pyrimidine-nucleoside phosphorylase